MTDMHILMFLVAVNSLLLIFIAAKVQRMASVISNDAHRRLKTDDS